MMAAGGACLIHQYWGGGGGANQAWQTSILGGGDIAKSAFTHALTCTCMHTGVKYSYTHECMYTHVCMGAQPMQTYILHPDMKIIKIEASDLYEKTTTNIYKSTRKVLVIYIA